MLFDDSAHVPAATGTLGKSLNSLSGQGGLHPFNRPLPRDVRQAARAQLDQQWNEMRQRGIEVRDAAMRAPFDQGAALRRPENVQKLTDGHVIPVYVRKGSDNRERWLSFTIPDDINQSDVLARGMAVDGNPALLAINGGHASEVGWQYGGVF